MSNRKYNSNTAVLELPTRNATRTAAKGPDRTELEAVIAAISRSQAVIEFRMDGTILTANDNFLHAVGYMREEIVGKHHSIFVDETYKQSAEYREFWAKLNRGEYQAAEYRRIGKGGKEVWIQASYNPILDPNGRPVKVVKFATDITEQKSANLIALRQHAIIENSPLNIMFADPALKIQYMNPASVRTLKKLEQYLPVRADEMIGKSIDIFHRNPAHQRALLENPRPENFHAVP